MMALEKFSEIPERGNGATDVTAEWWNILKRAGERLESILGDGLTQERQLSIANDDTDEIPNLVLDASAHSYYKIELIVKRQNDSEFRRSKITLEAFYNDENDEWLLSWDESFPQGLNPSGLEFSIDDADTTASQVSYSTDDMSGGNYVGTTRWKIVQTFDIEE